LIPLPPAAAKPAPVKQTPEYGIVDRRDEASELSTPKIDRVFVGLDEYAAAHDYVGTNAQIGKIIVALDGANAGQKK